MELKLKNIKFVRQNTEGENVILRRLTSREVDALSNAISDMLFNTERGAITISNLAYAATGIEGASIEYDINIVSEKGMFNTTRNFNGHLYDRFDYCEMKTEAREEASALRRHGRRSRVTRVTYGYIVWVRQLKPEHLYRKNKEEIKWQTKNITYSQRGLRRKV